MKFKKSIGLMTASTILLVMITAFASQITETTSITQQEDYYGSLSLRTNYCIDAYMMFVAKVG